MTDLLRSSTTHIHSMCKFLNIFGARADIKTPAGFFGQKPFSENFVQQTRLNNKRGRKSRQSTPNVPCIEGTQVEISKPELAGSH